MIEISSDEFVCELATDAPAAVEVEPGTTLKIHCRSALDMRVGPGPVRAEGPNPGTGPIAVAGAVPGQALRFEILDIAVESPGHVAADWEGEEQAVAIRDGRVLFHGLEIPLAPMIGTLGVAPEMGSWQTMAAGPFGGNLDTNDVCPGAVVFIPVFQPGGRFILGDVHAVMGEGEIGGQGLEVAATVTLQVDIEPAPLSDHLYILRDGRLMVIGAAEKIEDAVEDAVAAMTAITAGAGIVDEFNARKLLGLVGDTLFGQHCCPIKTVRVAVPLEYLPGLQSIVHRR